MASFARQFGHTGSGSPAEEARRLVEFLTRPVSQEPSATPDFDPTGQTIADRYRIRRVIGQGSCATVYEAADTRLSSSQSDALVAVKIANTETAVEAERWLDEARNARRVQHRNVVRVLDCGIDKDNHAFTVLELVAGPTLEQHARTLPRRARRQLIALFAQAAEGLEAIHAAGLVHCDIKPANLLLAPDGTLKVTDFGASALCAPQAAFTQTSPSMARGTLAFMAPELFRLDRESFMPSSDIFSLGATLYWLLTGNPVAGDNPAEAICGLGDRAGIDADRLDRQLRDAGIDRDLRAITLRAVAPQISDRYASAGVLAADLRAWVARRPVESTRPNALRRTALLVRRRPVASAAFALALLGSTTAAVAVEHSRQLAQASAAQAAELSVERAKSEADAAWRKRALDSLRRLMSGFSSAKEQGLAAEVLTSLWVLEWAHGPTLLQSPEALGELWNTRIDTLAAVREQARAAAGPDSIEARLTEPSLALWLLRDGRAAEALAILDDTVLYWQHHAPPNDPWLSQLDALRAAAAAMHLRTTASVRPLTSDEHALLAEYDTRVRAEHDRLAALGDRGPVAQLLRDLASQ